MERISVAHLARVEGHGGIEVTFSGNRVVDVNFEIFEGSRFFEPLLVGRSWDEVPGIVCRVCAICSSGHYVTALKAVEDALGLEVSAQTEALRELLFLGQMIESHALHLFCLAVPDFLGYSGAIPLAADHPHEVRLGLSLKKLGNDLQTAIGGRPIHPVNAIVGGFGRLPDREVLRGLSRRLREALGQAPAVVALFAGLKVPNHSESPAVYVALEPEGRDFSFFGRRISASTGEVFDVHDYRKVTNEAVVGHSHAKHSRLNGRPYMVGSLARLHHWGDRLTPQAQAVARQIGLTLPTENIMYNNHAQAVELIWSLERAADLIDGLLAAGLTEEPPVRVTWSSPRTGTAATEVPRGTLYHSYDFDAQGRVAAADVITPTAQNLANVEKDLRAAAERLAGKPEAELVSNFELIVRAYDPCISCSVHLIRLARRNLVK
ncbi:MAG: Ni/Fe hydrogenase subunit alpha [Betaproteobacteria bacterium]